MALNQFGGGGRGGNIRGTEEERGRNDGHTRLTSGMEWGKRTPLHQYKRWTMLANHSMS